MISVSSTFMHFAVALCLMHHVRAQFECDTGPNAMTTSFRTSIPQTCIDVPADNEDSLEFRTRCYYTYAPESCDFVDPVPLVVDVHGLGGCPMWHAFYSGWKEKAEEECFVVMWPTGNDLEGVSEACFNAPGLLKSDDFGEPDGNNVITIPCCCESDKDETEMIRRPGSGPDDALFLKMAIDKVLEDSSVAIDSNRVYMTGHSNGCIMSLSMAAQYSDSIAAVCCHAGALTTPFADDYSQVPIWMVHGMEDRVIKYEGESQDTVFGKFGVWSMDQTIDYLAKENGCDTEATESDLTDDEDNVIGKVVQKTGCKADVELVALFESGHFPYEIPTLFQGMLAGSGEVATTIDTTAMAWDFCSAYSKEDAVVEEDNGDDAESSSARSSYSGKLLLGVLSSVSVLSSSM